MYTKGHVFRFDSPVAGDDTGESGTPWGLSLINKKNLKNGLKWGPKDNFIRV